jgi:hypothetical protein
VIPFAKARRVSLLLLLSGWPAFASAAVTPASLTLVQAASPLDVFRDGSRLAPGRDLAIAAGDQLRTGATGRGSLRFGATLMTLGADGALRVAGVDEADAASSRSAQLRLELVRGVVRIDGTNERKLPQDVRLNVAELRLRVFGADVWAEASERRRSVCLLSGAVEVQTGSGSTERLDRAGDCLVVDTAGTRRQQPDAQAMRARLALTDYVASPVAVANNAAPVAVPAPGAPAARQEPAKIAAVTPATATGWTLVTAALADSESAEAEAQGLVEMGLPGVVRIHDLPTGQRVYRVTIGSFATKQLAEQFGVDVKTRFGMTQIWAAPY